MRPSLSLKTLLRTPLKTIMTFLLIALASFALFSRIADYSVTAREMKKVEDSYHGVIAIDNGVPILDSLKQQFSNLPKSTSYIPPARANKTPLVSPVAPPSLTREQIDAFSKLPNSAAENRFMTGGVIENSERLSPAVSPEYDWGYDYGARFIIEGTFSGHSERPFINPGGFVLSFSDINQLAGRRLYQDGETMPLLVGQILADDPDTIDDGNYYYPSVVYFGEDSMMTLLTTASPNSLFLFPSDPYRGDFVKELVFGTRYLFIGRYIPNTFDKAAFETDVKDMVGDSIKSNSISGLSDKGINELERGVFTIEPIEETVARYEENKAVLEEFYGKNFNLGLPELISGNPMMRLGDYETYDYVPSFIETSDSENIAKLQDIIDITNQDLHTFDIVYTENMAAIPRFNERSMVITSGRAITSDDIDSCVISEYLANAYNIKLGDKLNIGLGDRLFEQYAQMGAIAYIPERKWEVVRETELEIVGIYKEIDAMESRNADMFMGYSPNTIFVPLSQLPIEIPADHEIKPGEFSIFVQNPADFEKVLAEAEPLAAEMGVKLRASDGGYANIKDSINESAKTSVITMSLYVFAAALALVLSIYLYIGRNTKSYAIMRALGTTIEKSRSSLTLPFGMLCTAGILLGGIVGLMYTQNEMKAVLKSFEVLGSSYTADASIPVVTIIFALICEVVFISFFTALFLHRLAITSPLTLLQGDSSKKTKPKKVKKTITESAVTSMPFEIRAFVLSPLPEKRNYSALRQSFGYILRHMARTKWKTVIALILSFALTVALGVITMTKSNYEEMFRQVDVKSSINNFNQTSVLELAGSDLVREIYFFIDRPFVINNINNAVDLRITNDIDRYFNDTYKNEPPIIYADGYTDDLFNVDILSDSDNVICVVGSKIAEEYNINLGDDINLLDYDIYKSCTTLLNDINYAKIVSAAYAGKYETDEELQELVNLDIETAMAGWTYSYKVVGITKSENSDITNTLYMPYGKTTEMLISGNEPDVTLPKLSAAFAETVLSDNERVEDINTLLENYAASSMGYWNSDSAGSASYYTDTTELDNIRRVRDLLTALFPIAVAAAVLIGAAVPILIIIQSSKEAAIMRVLGTTKKRTIAILALEQVILCILGIVIATGVLLIYNAELFIQSGSTLAICAGIYLAASIAAALIAAAATTNKKALELLQVKE
jgi:ABC-type antimicrobial peptide transport system permease subunit